MLSLITTSTYNLAATSHYSAAAITTTSYLLGGISSSDVIGTGTTAATVSSAAGTSTHYTVYDRTTSTRRLLYSDTSVSNGSSTYEHRTDNITYITQPDDNSAFATTFGTTSYHTTAAPADVTYHVTTSQQTLTSDITGTSTQTTTLRSTLVSGPPVGTARSTLTITQTTSTGLTTSFTDSGLTTSTYQRYTGQYTDGIQSTGVSVCEGAWAQSNESIYTHTSETASTHSIILESSLLGSQTLSGSNTTVENTYTSTTRSTVTVTSTTGTAVSYIGAESISFGSSLAYGTTVAGGDFNEIATTTKTFRVTTTTTTTKTGYEKFSTLYVDSWYTFHTTQKTGRIIYDAGSWKSTSYTTYSETVSSYFQIPSVGDILADSESYTYANATSYADYTLMRSATVATKYSLDIIAENGGWVHPSNLTGPRLQGLSAGGAPIVYPHTATGKVGQRGPFVPALGSGLYSNDNTTVSYDSTANIFYGTDTAAATSSDTLAAAATQPASYRKDLEFRNSTSYNTDRGIASRSFSANQDWLAQYDIPGPVKITYQAAAGATSTETFNVSSDGVQPFSTRLVLAIEPLHNIDGYKREKAQTADLIIVEPPEGAET